MMDKLISRLLWLVIIAGIVFYVGVSWMLSTPIIQYENTINLNDSQWRATYAPFWQVSPTENVDILNEDRTLVADVYDNPAEANCGVIVLHGLNSTRNVVQQYGPLFYQMGCDVMSYDFAPLNNDVPFTYGDDEKDDLAVVVEWFSEYTGLPQSQIGLFGTSVGAATALQYLPQNPDIAWAIADSSYASMSSIISRQMDDIIAEQVDLINRPSGIFLPLTSLFIEQRIGITVSDVSPERSVAEVDTPILLIHADNDLTVIPDDSQDIFDNANPDTTRLEITFWDSEHAQSYVNNKEDYAIIVLDFLAEFAPEFGNQEAVIPEDL